ncbi:TylF/MycF/NovP-related O-methyltransferase [Breoghania sp.]|uniref:TylF/MycF/NovP-related O-methyltransferase n=1 Tax=Breoghania sp. TaxID=2065378 RepID=UPI002AAB7ED9|nr:TylF/MycF/NovP-related O-methyltransferase [Breoghania sp.]
MAFGIGRALRGKSRKAKAQPYEYEADNLAVRKKNLGFLRNPDFARAWQQAADGNAIAWSGRRKDVRWRAHTAVWAARHGLKLEGDFVECGVFLGFLSMTICHALNFATVPKTFYLFDTFDGIPDDGSTETARRNGSYFDCYDQASKNFEPFPNAKLVRGRLPKTLEDVTIDRIAYLSVDLNHAGTEKAVINELWDRLSPSAIVLIDDYAFAKHEDQHEMWDEFATSKGCSVLTMPTGSGVLIRP